MAPDRGAGVAAVDDIAIAVMALTRNIDEHLGVHQRKEKTPRIQRRERVRPMVVAADEAVVAMVEGVTVVDGEVMDTEDPLRSQDLAALT